MVTLLILSITNVLSSRSFVGASQGMSLAHSACATTASSKATGKRTVLFAPASGHSTAAPQPTRSRKVESALHSSAVVNGVMSAQLRRSARKRKNTLTVVAASERMKVNQRILTVISVLVLQISTTFPSNHIDTVIIPNTTLDMINSIYTEPGLYTSAKTFPATSII
ncbi:unnamed protein product [Mytilus coruscus]|uniref:Uncharacterized protein n=1 Tax=Mytilus coruscus TaxID=42192 RepID=A0A6J8D636_MYTCO|nr:unnamed protein product [Mytilus coruscus]